MMKKTLTLLLIILIYPYVNAQMDYIVTDSISAQISDMEKMTAGQSYKDNNGLELILSFPPEPFTLWSYNLLASKAVYRKKQDVEILTVTEDIDLTKATGISVSDNYNNVAFIRVDFPKGHLKTQIFKDGNLIGNENEDYLEFFCPYGKVDENKELYFDKQFMALYNTIMQLKIEKNLIDSKTVELELKSWKTGAENFTAKYPKSILNAQLEKNRIEKEKLKPQIEYVMSLMEKFGLKKGLTPEGYVAFNPATQSLFRKGKEYDGVITYSNVKGMGNPYPIGPFAANVLASKNIVYSYSHNIYSGKEDSVTEQINAFYKDIYNHVDAKYVVEEGVYTVINVPNAPMKIRLHLAQYNRWQALSIGF